VHDVGTLPDGRVFYAMKLVTGKRLDELLKAGLPLRERLRADTFDSLFTLIDDATPPPRIQFTLAQEMRGFDFVEEVRASAR
jgi:hypothetical protein